MTAAESNQSAMDELLPWAQGSREAVMLLGSRGEVRAANPAAAELLGHGTEALVGRPLGCELRVGPWSEITIKTPEGERREVELRIESAEPLGLTGYLARLQDRSRLQRAERSLALSEQREALTQEVANDAIITWDLEGETVDYGARFAELLGLRPGELGSSPSAWREKVHPEDRPQVRSALNAHLSGETATLAVEYRIRHADGSWRYIRCQGKATPTHGPRPRRLIAAHTDITEGRRAEEQLAHRAFYDPLTDLPNRSLFLDRLRHAMRRAKRRRDYLFAVLFLDLDRFKVINDSLGHMAGDQLLVKLARRLEGSLRPGDTVARLGGDEFTVLLDDIHDVTDAHLIADRIQRELTAPFHLGKQEIFSSASIGIALSDAGYEKPEDILRDADTAMYRAKGTGPAKQALFDTGMHERAVAQLELEADMRKAIERDELVMHYQPIVSLRSGRITGLEALVRWNHPRHGLLYPNTFVPLAEESGLVVAMGRKVLRKVCEQMGDWKRRRAEMRSLSVNVNLSSRQFSLPELVSHVDQALSDSGLSPAFLRLEITESALMENADVATGVLEKLKALGVQVSLDDFGTGYSSLAYLQEFEIDSLKIDRSFVGDLEKERESLEIARTIVNIGRNLGMGVIAEGIECAEQLELLRELECEHGQGYFFAKPLPTAEIEALVSEGRSW